MNPRPSASAGRRAGRRAFMTLLTHIRLGFACSSLAGARFSILSRNARLLAGGVMRWRLGNCGGDWRGALRCEPTDRRKAGKEAARHPVSDSRASQGTCAGGHGLCDQSPRHVRAPRPDTSRDTSPRLASTRSCAMQDCPSRVLSHLAMNRSVVLHRASAARIHIHLPADGQPIRLMRRTPPDVSQRPTMAPFY